MRHLTIAAIVIVTGGMLLGGCAETWRATPEPPSGEASVFRYPWTWLDDHGERVSLSKWRGTPLVVTAVYTTCFETCPMTIARLRTVHDELTRAGRRAEFVVVTLDPTVDTPERLRQFRQARGLPDAWHLLTGSRRDTEQLMAVLDVHIMDMDVHLVHDSKITLFDVDGRRTAELGVR
jgi:protein SCO1/2